MLPAAAEVCCDADGAYRAHAIVGFRAYEYAPRPDAINPLFLSHPAMVCSLLGYCSLENRKDLQSGPSLSLSN